MAANVHTNHALDTSVAEVTFPAAPGSLGRYERAASLVETTEPTMRIPGRPLRLPGVTGASVSVSSDQVRISTFDQMLESPAGFGGDPRPSVHIG
jgi:hypothetical protein